VTNTSTGRGYLPAWARFDRLAVIERSGSDRAGRIMYRCRCKCGEECLVRGADLRSGHTKSCGCLRAIKRYLGKIAWNTFGSLQVWCKVDEHERGVKPTTKWYVACRMCGQGFFIATTKQIRAGTKHCVCLEPTRTSWRDMIQRCTNKNHAQYKDYGGRGIGICDGWRNSFVSFMQDMGRRPEGKTLDRYPNRNGNYEPGNCRWATKKDQAQNRRKPECLSPTLQKL